MWMCPDLYSKGTFISGAAIPCYICRTGFINFIVCGVSLYCKGILGGQPLVFYVRSHH